MMGEARKKHVFKRIFDEDLCFVRCACMCLCKSCIWQCMLACTFFIDVVFLYYSLELECEISV